MPDAAPVRLIVRRVKPTPGSQLVLTTAYSFHGFITYWDGDTLELEANHRRHSEVENAIRDLKYGVGLNHRPSGRFAANGFWLAIQSLPRTRYGVMAHNLARCTARIALGEQVLYHQDTAAVLLPGRTDNPARPTVSACICLRTGRGKRNSAAPWPGSEPFHSQPYGTHSPPTRPAHNGGPADSRHNGRRAHPSVSCVLISPPGPSQTAIGAFPPTLIQARIIAPVTPSHPSSVPTPSTSVNRWIRAKTSAN